MTDCGNGLPGPTAAIRLLVSLPVAARLESGTLVHGAADLVLLGADDFVLVHQQASARVGDRAAAYSGQLEAHVTCIERATDLALAHAWIHFPLAGQVVPVSIG